MPAAGDGDGEATGAASDGGGVWSPRLLSESAASGSGDMTLNSLSPCASTFCQAQETEETEETASSC